MKRSEANPLSDEILESDIAILGKKGGGKTYTSKGLVERLLDLGRRVLVLDPLGVWAGLRTGADGRTPGYPVAIFGGEHADLPLDLPAAEPLARLLAAENLPAVMDLSDLSKSAQQAFLQKFLHELRRVNRDALTIVLEEADVFSPQSPLGDDSRMLHGEIDWIARRGRFRGFRLITITQRPARLSKDVLTQANCLIMHRLPAPQDREAARAWVDGNGDREKSKEVFDTLSNLAVGEGWVLAQEPMMLERARFPKIRTLDTSATPRAGERRVAPKTLAEVDVASIREALAMAESDGKPPCARLTNAREAEEAEARGYRRGFADGQAKGAMDMHARIRSAMTGLLESMAGTKEESIVSDAPPVSGMEAAIDPLSVGRRKPVARRSPKEDAGTAGAGQDISADPFLKAARLVWPARMSWAVLASMCGRKARGGSFNTRRRRLLDRGYLREEGGLVTLVDPPEMPEGTIPADLLEANLPTPSAEAFRLIRSRPGIGIDELAAALGVVPRGGSWNTRMSILRRNGLIVEGDGLHIAPGLVPADDGFEKGKARK